MLYATTTFWSLLWKKLFFFKVFILFYNMVLEYGYGNIISQMLHDVYHHHYDRYMTRFKSNWRETLRFILCNTDTGDSFFLLHQSKIKTKQNCNGKL